MKRTMTLLAFTATLIPGLVMAAERSGEEVYNSKCAICHATGTAGAPKLGDAAAWAPRIALGEDALLATVKSGKGGMPPKGLCMDCTDSELRSAIDYMVDRAQ